MGHDEINLRCVRDARCECAQTQNTSLAQQYNNILQPLPSTAGFVASEHEAEGVLHVCLDRTASVLHLPPLPQRLAAGPALNL